MLLTILGNKKTGRPWWSSGQESALQCEGHVDPGLGCLNPTCQGATKPPPQKKDLRLHNEICLS